MQVNALEEFKEFLKLVAPLSKRYGFSRRGQNFYTRRDGNWGVINFQKSQSSTHAKVKFTVNLGIYSQILAKFYYKWKEGTPPTESACHWHKRVEPGNRAKWWAIDESTLLPSLLREFGDILPMAVSEIESYITDEALRDLLLSGDCAGASNHVRLENLSVLVKRYGPFDIQDFILAELRNSGVDHVVEGHIERLKGVEAAEEANNESARRSMEN
jgi:hypothetical protein